jgi:acyl-CoA thioesterase I
MSVANQITYMKAITDKLKLRWPDNETINIVCHGHSVPAGYFANSHVDTFNAYPHLLHRNLKERFPNAVINVIVTAIGGENAESGAARFEDQVLCHRPSVITIDYGLNDRGIGLERAEKSWRSMIDKALRADTKIVLLTPSWDVSAKADPEGESWVQLKLHADMIRKLASEYEVGVSDSFEVFERYNKNSGDYLDLMSWVNHMSRKGHELVAGEITKWFQIYSV